MERNIGRYRVIEELGRGGMGTVYHAVDPLLERDVAIKVLHPQKLARKTALERFLREARIAARLDNPYIIKVYDIGSEDDVYHIVMEFVRGVTLRDVISVRESIEAVDTDLMVKYFWQICRAFDYAHEMKIVHRDIKPENIMVADTGRIKVMDLGLAVLEDSSPLTSVGDVLGTFSYFSPEQARGERADARSDIYSLGIVFFEMLTNDLPFRAQSPSEMIQKHLYMAPPSILSLHEGLSPLLDEIVQKSLCKDAAERYQSVRSIIDDLGRYVAERNLFIGDVETPHPEPLVLAGQEQEREPPFGDPTPAPPLAESPGAPSRAAAPAVEETERAGASICVVTAPPVPAAPVVTAPPVPPQTTAVISGAPVAGYGTTPVIAPPGTEKFVGVAGDLYSRFQKQQQEKWKKVLLLAGAVLALFIFDAVMARFFRVNVVSKAYWSDDGRDIVFTKALGSALDFATDLNYPQIGGDELWVHHLRTGKSERLIEREYKGHLAPYPSNIEGNYLWMARYGKNSEVVVFPLQDKTTVLTWKFEGIYTDLMVARGKKALVCRDKGDVGLMEMGDDPVYVFHAHGPYTLRGRGLADMTGLGARAVFAERTSKSTNIYIWDRQYRNAICIANSAMSLARLTIDGMGKYPTWVLKYPGNQKDYEFWMVDTVAGQSPRTLYKSKDGFQALQWSPDGTLLALATTSKLLFFAPADKQPRASYDVLGIRNMAFSPDSRSLFYAIGNQLHALALTTGKVTDLPVEVPRHSALSFSPDGKYLMLRTSLETGGSHFGIYLYDCAGGKLRKIAGASPSHWLATFFGYRLYVVVRNFIVGRKARLVEETAGP